MGALTFPFPPVICVTHNVIDMPAHPRSGFRRPGRTNSRNRPARNHNGRGVDLSRRSHSPARDSPRMGYPRTEMISRNLIRLLRHEPRRSEAPPPLKLADGASLPSDEVSPHSTFRCCGIDEQELERIVSDDDPTRKLRFGVYNSPNGGTPREGL